MLRLSKPPWLRVPFHWFVAIRTRYTTGYSPQAENGGRALRRIRICVSAPGHVRLSGRSRSSYRYDDVSKQGKEKE